MLDKNIYDCNKGLVFKKETGDVYQASGSRALAKRISRKNGSGRRNYVLRKACRYLAELFSENTRQDEITPVR